MSNDEVSRITIIKQTVLSLLDDLENNNSPIIQLLMKAKRLARLLRDEDAQRWLDLETIGYPDGFTFSELGKCETYARSGGRIRGDKYWFASLPEIEAQIEADKQFLHRLNPSTTTSTVENRGASNATILLLQAQNKLFSDSSKRYSDRCKLYAALKSGIHSYVSATYISIELGDYVQDIFESSRLEVDKFVSAKSPKAAEQMVSISERMRENDPESWSAALTACRRLLSSVADAVFPSQDQPYIDRKGKSRDVGNDNYKNRLLAFLDSSHEAETVDAILDSEIEFLASKLDAVYEKACKGVHADINAQEARLVVISTYLFIAEIARYSK